MKRARESATSDVNRESAYGLRGDAHIGEASHPGPTQGHQCLRKQYHRHTSAFKCAGPASFCAWDDQSQCSQYSQVNALPHTDFSAAAAEERNVTTAHSSSLLSQGQPFGEYNENRVERIVISLCDGIGGALLALNTVNAAVTRYIAVESNDTAKVNDLPVVIPTLLCLSTQDQMLGEALLMVLEKEGFQHTAAALSRYDGQEQVHMLAPIKRLAPSGNALAVNQLGWSGLDSGSSRHIHPDAVVTDADHTVSLTGFDSSQQWTSGYGYLPVQFLSRETGATVSQDVQSVVVMQNLVHPILLMGSLIRSGYDFVLGDSGKDMYATIPGGDTVRLELGVDDIVRLPHAIRTSRSKEALLVLKLQSVGAISRTMKEMNGVIMHQVFNHSNRETLYYTLTNTIFSF